MSTENISKAKPPGLSAVEIQQEYYEAIGGVDWELYKKSDRKYLLQKVAVALCGPPTKEGNLGTNLGCDSDAEKKNTKELNKSKVNNDTNRDDDFKLQGYELREEESITKVFNKICEQAQYSHNGENILITTLRVVCVIPKEEVPLLKLTPDDYWVNLHDKNGDHVHTLIFHVFCIRQCISMNYGVTGCRVFIDHDARVYKNWNSYLTENHLPKSVMVVPENGQYNGTFGPDVDLLKLEPELLDAMPRVKLSVVPTPALGLGAKVLQVTDTISTVANVGALLGLVGAVFAAPVVAPVALVAATGVGVVTGTYAIARASIVLHDRTKHEQSIGLEDSESRSCWINILVSTAGISCTAAGKLLAWAASSGTNVKIFINAVNFLQYTNLGTGFIGVANGLGEMIYKFHKYDEIPSGLEVFQFTTSVLFLGIGVMSNQTAQEIVQDAQANKINEVRDSLSSNNKRKMFDKVTAETRRTRGTIQGNAEIIKALNKIENKDEFFGKLRGMNKQLNKNKLRISLSSDGNPLINNQHNIKVADLQTLGRKGRDQLFAKYGPAKVNSKNAPTRIYASNTSAQATTVQQKSSIFILPAELVKVYNFIMKLSRMDQEFIAELLSDISAALHDTFLLICAEIIASLIPSEIDKLLDWNEHYKMRIILLVFDYLKSQIDVDYSPDNVSFTNVLKRYVRDGRIPKETILEIKRVLLNKINKPYKMFNDPRLFDIMHDYDTRCNKTYLNLQAGQVLKLGKHDIMIKSSTIDNLGEWFQFFLLSQLQSEMIINLCCEIITCLSAREVSQLNDINPDDDAINIIVHYLLFAAEGILDFLIEDYAGTEFFADIAHNMKGELMYWCVSQKLRKYETCKVCQGRRYTDK